MIKFKWKDKAFKSTPLTDNLVTLFGGATLIYLLDLFIKLQDTTDILLNR